jgi:hypothetical protein
MSDNTEFRKELEERTKQINEQIESYLPEEKGHQKTIFEAMNYSVKAGGKRLRPLFMQEICRLFTGEVQPVVVPFIAEDTLFEIGQNVNSKIGLGTTDYVSTETALAIWSNILTGVKAIRDVDVAKQKALLLKEQMRLATASDAISKFYSAQLSAAKGSAQVTAGLQSSLCDTIEIFAGQTIEGTISSTIVTIAVADDTLPFTSVTVKVTKFSPTLLQSNVVLFNV